MRIKYEIELINDVIGVETTVAKILVTKGYDKELSGTFILGSNFENDEDLLSPAVVSLLSEAVGKLTGNVVDKKKTRRKKDESAAGE